jgi:hypothetical protein
VYQILVDAGFGERWRITGEIAVLIRNRVFGKPGFRTTTLVEDVLNNSPARKIWIIVLSPPRMPRAPRLSLELLGRVAG